MGLAEKRAKSQQLAEYLKSRLIERKTGQCPMGCGYPFPVDNKGALLSHLQKCRGNPRKDRRNVTPN